MSRFSGSQYKGAGRAARQIRREEAIKRTTVEKFVGNRLGRKAREGDLDPAIYGEDGRRLAGVR